MNFFSGFNLPPNGYYNPQPPRRQPIQQAPEPTVFDYTAVANGADTVEMGGNGNGTLDQQEVALSVNQTANAVNYYRNMFQATGNLQYKQAAYMSNQFFQASVNMQNEYNTFAKADPNGNGGITQQGIYNLASKDGNVHSVSYQDVGLQPQPMYNNQPPQYGGGQPLYNNQPPQYGGGQPMYNQPQYGGGGMPFPPPFQMMPRMAQDLTYLQAKADNPNAWDGKQLAVGINNRINQLDTDGDKQISYAEAMNSADGLLGNVQLNLRPGSPESMRIWAGISGTDGKINARELASTILSVDSDSDGTVTAKETFAFASELDQRTGDKDMAARMYDYINQKGNRFGLDTFIAETQETKDVRTTAKVSKETEKSLLKNGKQTLEKTTENLLVKLKGLDPKTTEAEALNHQLNKVQINSAVARDQLILTTLKEGYPEDPAGFTAEGKNYETQVSTKASELKSKLAKLDANTPEAKALNNAVTALDNLSAQANLPRSYGSSNLAAETKMRTVNEAILQNQLLKRLDATTNGAKVTKQNNTTNVDAYEHLPQADVSKLSAEGKKLFTVGEEYMATAKKLQLADVKTPAGKALQAKLDTLETQFIEASNLNMLPVVEPKPPTPPVVEPKPPTPPVVEPKPPTPPVVIALTPKTASQTLINNFGEFEGLLDTNMARRDGIAQFNELVEYTKKADAKPEVKAAAQYFIDNRTTTFDVMEGINDRDRKDGIFSLDELRKFEQRV